MAFSVSTTYDLEVLAVLSTTVGRRHLSLVSVLILFQNRQISNGMPSDALKLIVCLACIVLPFNDIFVGRARLDLLW